MNKLIKDSEDMGSELNFRLYELLGNKTYLEKAYEKVQKNANSMETLLKEKYLSYPIPKKIIEEFKNIFH